jgi:hypothetical protein
MKNTGTPMKNDEKREQTMKHDEKERKKQCKMMKNRETTMNNDEKEKKKQ